jgi:hypothetical protein
VPFLSRLQAYFLAQGKTFAQEIMPTERQIAAKEQ